MQTGRLSVSGDFWWSVGFNSGENGIVPFSVFYFDKSDLNLKLFKLAELDTDLSPQLADEESTKGLVPVILIDSKIEITSGDGSYDNPYVYTFNK